MIKAVDIMHPEDRKALQMLQAIPCIDTICKKLMNMGCERIFKGENLANMFRCLGSGKGISNTLWNKIQQDFKMAFLLTSPKWQTVH